MEHNRLQSRNVRRPWRRRVAFAVIIVAALALTVNALLPTTEEELAAIDEAWTVADEDNAALIYAELFQGERIAPSEEDMLSAEDTSDPVLRYEIRIGSADLVALELREGLLDPNDELVTVQEPWTSAEYPELRQWLDQHRNRIARLEQAADKPACYFPLRPSPGHLGLFDVPLGAFRQHVLLLARAANNDVGEGNIGAALRKDQTLISVGRHFQMQPSGSLFLSGIACEAMGLHHLAKFIVTGSATNRDLDTLVAKSSDLADHWASIRRNISHVRSVFARSLEAPGRFNLRIYQWYRRTRYQDEGWYADRRAELYHRMLCERRAHYMLIALRQFRNQKGHWPDGLDEIASSLDPLVLIDPQNGGTYVYQRTEEGFRLYSTGPNGEDEGGHYAESVPDDWPIWPPRERPRTTEPKDANDV